MGTGGMGTGGMDGTATADTGAPTDAGEGRGVAGGTNAVANIANYIDGAVPRTQIRFRFDSEYNINLPDRGEFYYPKCGCFGTPDAKGPRLPARRIRSDQEYATYLEFAPCERFSGFIESPYRALNPDYILQNGSDLNVNFSGFSDLNAGFKFAILYEDGQVLTTQVRVYAPTGDGRKGLGTRHTSIEPALLYYQRLAKRLFLETEVRDWVGIGGSDFESNVLRYGVGLSFLAYDSCKFRVFPVAEAVGWTFLGGKEFSPILGGSGTKSADGDTIVNAKMGLRFGFGDLSQPGFLSGSDLGISYGRALTGDFLYKDILRVEYRMRF
jgi:hypothetical protein